MKYYSPTESRDLRLDFLRGYFVFVMTIDHLVMFPAWTSVFTGANQLWVSALIGFILVSGIVMGRVYRRRIAGKSGDWLITHVGRRAFQLYFLGALGRLILATGDYILRLVWQRPSTLPDSYWHLFIGAVLHKGYSFKYVDMLPLYALLLPMGLGAVYFLQKGKGKWVILTSVALWFASRTDPSAFSVLRIGFNPFVWQLPFILSVVVGYYRDEIGRWWAQRPFPRFTSFLLVGSTLALLFINYQIAFNGMWPNIDWVQISTRYFDKGSAAPGRIIAAFWVFAGLYELINLLWPVWQRTLGWLILPLGQNALIAYLTQGFVSYLISRLPGYPFLDLDRVMMGFIHLGVVLAVWQITRMVAKLIASRRLTWPSLRLAAIKIHPKEKPTLPV